jgi:GT2 family glycosyltransferase
MNETCKGSEAKSGVTVSLITWNDRENILRCLSSVRAQTYSQIRIIVVDNASTDGSIDTVRLEFPEVTLLSPGENLGYTGGHNLSFAASDDPYFLALNPDLTLDPNFVARLVAAMEEDPGLGAVSGKLLRADDAEEVQKVRSERCEGRDVAVLDSAGIAPDRFGRFRDLGEGLPDDGRIPFGEVFGVCGAAAFYRREAVVDAVPDIPGAGRPFDVAFFIYYEDGDLAWQLQRRGWRACIVPEAVGFHIRGGSGVSSPRIEHLLHRNALWVLVKQASPGYLARIAPGLLIYETVKLAQSFLWRAQWERLKGLPAMWRRRRVLQENARRPRVAPRSPAMDVLCRPCADDEIFTNGNKRTAGV